MSAYITGTGAYLPGEPVANDRIEQVLGRLDGSDSQVKDVILHHNQIASRHYAIDPETGRQTCTNAQLTAEAIHTLAENCGLDFSQIELLACGTSTPDQMVPSHASMVHGLVGCPPCEIASTSGVCCSSMSALKYAYLSVVSESVDLAVAAGSELASPLLAARHFRGQSWAAPGREGGQDGRSVEQEPYLAFEHEFLRWMLSDGAAAVRLQNRPREDGLSLRIDWLDLISFANELETCMYAGGVKRADGSLQGWLQAESLSEAAQAGCFNLSQDVRLLKDNIVSVAFQRSFAQVRKKRRLLAESVDWLLPHLSSYFFQKPIEETLRQMEFDLPEQKWFTNLRDKGNTGAASMFIMLDELCRSGRLQRGDRLLCVIPESARFSFAYLHLTVE